MQVTPSLREGPPYTQNVKDLKNLNLCIDFPAAKWKGARVAVKLCYHNALETLSYARMNNELSTARKAIHPNLVSYRAEPRSIIDSSSTKASDIWVDSLYSGARDMS